MSFPRREAAIVGVYVTEQAKSLDRTAFSLQLEAVKGALQIRPILGHSHARKGG